MNKKIKIELTNEEGKYVWQAILLALGRAGELKELQESGQNRLKWNKAEKKYIHLRDKIWEQIKE